MLYYIATCYTIHSIQAPYLGTRKKPPFPVHMMELEMQCAALFENKMIEKHNKDNNAMRPSRGSLKHHDPGVGQGPD